MKSEWKEVRLGDVVILNYGKALTSTNRVVGEIPVYSSAGITGYHNTPLVNSEGIIVGRKGSVGTVYYSPNPFFCIDTAYYILPSEDYNLKYMYYRIRSLGLENLNEDSAVPGLNRDTAYSQIFLLPPLSEQHAIAAVLSCLDNKITNNIKINHHLEQMAQAIFKSWFVDFEPFADGDFIESELGKIPAGWSIATLDDICTKITDGSHFSPKNSENGNYPMLSVRDMDSYGFNYQSCKLINENDFAIMVANDCVPLVNDILVAKDGSYLKHIFIVNEQRKEAILSSIAIFRPNPEVIYPVLLLCLLKYPATQQTIKDNFVSGSALPRIVLKDFKKLKLVLPPIEVQLRISVLFSGIRKQIAEYQTENSILTKMRNLLLPRLMSGELSVADLAAK